MNVLFVCSGNISRSFLAEMLLKNELALANEKKIFVSSAGVFAYPGNQPDPKMVDYLNEKGVPITDHHARQISEREVDWADIILVMEKEHAVRIKNTWPATADKLELLGSFISKDQNVDDIIDPFGRSPYHYRLAQSQISLAVESLTRQLLLGQK